MSEEEVNIFIKENLEKLPLAFLNTVYKKDNIFKPSITNKQQFKKPITRY